MSTRDQMAGATPAVKAKLAMLSQRYAADLPRRVDEVVALFQLLKRNPAGVAVRRQLRRAVHALKGSGTTFGFPEVSEAASRLEAELDTWVDDALPGSGGFERFESLLNPLVLTARMGRRPSSMPGETR